MLRNPSVNRMPELPLHIGGEIRILIKMGSDVLNAFAAEELLVAKLDMADELQALIGVTGCMLREKEQGLGGGHGRFSFARWASVFLAILTI